MDEGIDSGPIIKLVLAEYERYEGSQNIHSINNMLNNIIPKVKNSQAGLLVKAIIVGFLYYIIEKFT